MGRGFWGFFSGTYLKEQDRGKECTFDYDVPFPIVKVGDREMYKCYSHGGLNGLLFPSEELAMIHYTVDHMGKTKRKFGYSFTIDK